MIYNFEQFFDTLSAVQKRSPAIFTNQEIDAISALTRNNPIFAALVQKIPHPYLKQIWQNSLRVAWAQEQVEPFIHKDPLFSASRSIARQWLTRHPIWGSESRNLEKQQYSIYPILIDWASSQKWAPHKEKVVLNYITFLVHELQGGKLSKSTLRIDPEIITCAISWVEHTHTCPEHVNLALRKQKIISIFANCAFAYAEENELAGFYFYEQNDFAPLADLSGSILDFFYPLAQTDPTFTPQNPQDTLVENYASLVFDALIDNSESLPQPTELFYFLYLHACFPDGFIARTNRSSTPLRISSPPSYTYYKAQAEYVFVELNKIQNLVQKIRYSDLKDFDCIELNAALLPYTNPPRPIYKNSGMYNPRLLRSHTIEGKLRHEFDQLLQTQLELYKNNHLPIDSIHASPFFRNLIIRDPLLILESASDTEQQSSVTDILENMHQLSGIEPSFLRTLCRICSAHSTLIDNAAYHPLSAFDEKRNQGIVNMQSSLVQRGNLIVEFQALQKKLISIQGQLEHAQGSHQIVSKSWRAWMHNSLSHPSEGGYYPLYMSPEQGLDMLDTLNIDQVSALLFCALAQGEKNFFYNIINRTKFDLAVLLNIRGFYGESLLHIAAYKGLPEIIDRLMEYMMSVDIMDNDNNTPLHVAHPGSTVTCLLSHLASPTIANIHGNTPLHLTCELGAFMPVRTLLGAGAISTLSMKNAAGLTPFHIACRDGLADLVQHFLQYTDRSTLHILTPNGLNGLGLACQNNHVHIARMLFEKDSSLLYTASQHMSPLLAATIANASQAVDFLLRNYANCDNITRNDGKTPLVVALDQQYMDIAEKLLRYGANIYATDKSGMNAVRLARKQKNYTLLKDMYIFYPSRQLFIVAMQTFKSSLQFNGILQPHAVFRFRNSLKNSLLSFEDRIMQLLWQDNKKAISYYPERVIRLLIARHSNHPNYATFLNRVDLIYGTTADAFNIQSKVPIEISAPKSNLIFRRGVAKVYAFHPEQEPENLRSKEPKFDI